MCLCVCVSVCVCVCLRVRVRVCVCLQPRKNKVFRVTLTRHLCMSREWLAYDLNIIHCLSGHCFGRFCAVCVIGVDVMIEMGCEVMLSKSEEVPHRRFSPLRAEIRCNAISRNEHLMLLENRT